MLDVTGLLHGTSDGAVDPDGDRIRYAWDFDGDGDVDSIAQDPTHTYRTNGVFRATLTVTYVLGHDDHGHPQTTASGCTGSIETTVPRGHDPGEDAITVVFVAEYTDPGGEGLPPLSGSDEVVLEPTE